MQGKYQTLYKELTRQRQMLAKAPRAFQDEASSRRRRIELDMLLDEIKRVKKDLANGKN